MGIGGIDPQQAKRGFVIASASMLAVFAAGAAPIPLYSVYQQTIGLTDLQINATMFLYLLGIMAVLLFAGRLSDALPAAVAEHRRPSGTPQIMAAPEAGHPGDDGAGVGGPHGIPVSPPQGR